MALSLLLALLTAAIVGSFLGDILGGGYGLRVALYAALLVYAVVGAVVLFARVAQHETEALSARRVGRWFFSLWLWPLLLASAARKRDG